LICFSAFSEEKCIFWHHFPLSEVGRATHQKLRLIVHLRRHAHHEVKRRLLQVSQVEVNALTPLTVIDCVVDLAERWRLLEQHHAQLAGKAAEVVQPAWVGVVGTTRIATGVVQVEEQVQIVMMQVLVVS